MLEEMVCKLMVGEKATASSTPMDIKVTSSHGVMARSVLGAPTADTFDVVRL